LKNATAGQPTTKVPVKAKSTVPTPVPAPEIVKEPTFVVKSPVPSSVGADEEEDRVYRCDQDGCFSSFKTRSSLRDHQKGTVAGPNHVDLYLI
jgi:hypothetical protein